MEYSFIIPVYNRPNEIEELLESFVAQNTKLNYEVVIIEDGSTITSEKIIEKFQEQLQISYYFKQNSGPGDSRNYGMQRAQANYFIILDSDVVLPPNYLSNVDSYLKQNFLHCFGGPDAAAKQFSPVQKAINFAMTSFITTGGIRGKKNAVKKFEPRSFNMGLSKKAFLASGGFGKIHPGEDPELVMRLRKQNFSVGFIPEAFVYHKRRIDWSKFYQQVYKFGLVRPILTSWHPQTANISFWFPAVFTIGFFVALVSILFNWYLPFLLYLFYFILVMLLASIQSKNFYIGLLSLRAVITMFAGYGFGFLKSTYAIRILNKNPEKTFPNLFF